MSTASEKIREIEAEMARTQKNKATMYHLGTLKARIAKLKRELIEDASKGAGGGGEAGFEVSKSGDCRVGMIGFPSVGKSTLLTKLTGTFSEAADYEFTTLTCIPGVIRYKGAKIQLLDMPGIIEGAKDGKGRGKQVIAVARTCNLILLVLDASKPLTHRRIIERELEGFGIRLNKQKPNIHFKRKDKGGINIQSSAPLTKLDHDTIKSVCAEYKVHNADIVFRYDGTVDDLIDVIEGNRKYIPCIYVMNCIDKITIQELDILDKVPNNCMISARHEWNMDELLENIWKRLDLIRIYTKPKGQIPDYNEPVVLPSKLNQASEHDNCWLGSFSPLPLIFACRSRTSAIAFTRALSSSSSTRWFGALLSSTIPKKLAKITCLRMKISSSSSKRFNNARACLLSSHAIDYA
jgi:small GTP-binding protein